MTAVHPQTAPTVLRDATGKPIRCAICPLFLASEIVTGYDRTGHAYDIPLCSACAEHRRQVQQNSAK